MLPKGGHFFQVKHFLAMFFSHVKLPTCGQSPMQKRNNTCAQVLTWLKTELLFKSFDIISCSGILKKFCS